MQALILSIHFDVDKIAENNVYLRNLLSICAYLQQIYRQLT